ncbi:hypothetical protein F511_19390 [Dorcoceras hygrometricum]|uniref:Uncharacterized protein n=1 Tax=Dorcoceras hygrometricum TaxID=472368 RepID=A0A2Z7C0R8_9LAMI|nr:hypothetical protein F511_19390 [Dorcoceras hygrometricum]
MFVQIVRVLAAGGSIFSVQVRSKSISDVVERPLDIIAYSRTGAQQSKRKLVFVPSDSDSTDSLELPELGRSIGPKDQSWTEVRLNTIRKMTLIGIMAKLEDDSMLWAETEKVSELLQRRLLILYRMYEEKLRGARALACHEAVYISAFYRWATSQAEEEKDMTEQLAQELIAVEELPPIVQHFFVEATEAPESFEAPVMIEHQTHEQGFIEEEHQASDSALSIVKFSEGQADTVQLAEPLRVGPLDYAEGPSNADPPHAKPTQATTQGPKHIKTQQLGYELNQRYSTPSNSAESSKQHKTGSEHLPQQSRTVMLTDYTREMSSRTSPTSSKRPKAISKRSVSARGVQRYHSYFNRSCLSSVIEEDKVRSCNRSLSKPKQISTNSNDVAENYCRNWTRHSLITAEQLTNICFATQHQISHTTEDQRCLLLSLLRYSKTLSFQLIQTTTYQLIQTTTFSYSLLKHASALSTAQRQQISLRLLNTTTQRPLLTSPLLNANIQR